MTRIVSGRAGGRVLEVPRAGTRPTSDRAREALFSTLAGLTELTGARVLDLFAGTGAVGLEALSRGAAHATLVESGREAGLALRRNVEALELPGALVRQQTVESFLAGTDLGAAFDLVFADPPYAYSQPSLAELLRLLTEPPGRLVAHAVVVLERAARSDPPPWPVVIEAIKSRRYGDTVLWYGRRH